jgi:uncharacterized protein YqeY
MKEDQMDNSMLEKIREDARQSLKSGDAKKAQALRYLLSLLQKAQESSVSGKVSEEEVLKILNKELKSKKEALELFKKGNRQDLAENEEYEINLLQEYLPKMMSAEEIEKVIEKKLAAGDDFGAAMGKVMAEVKGRADGALVAQLVRRKLNSL